MTPFIYSTERSFNVAEATGKYINENGLESIISEHGWICHYLGELIPKTLESFWSGNFFSMVGILGRNSS